MRVFLDACVDPRAARIFEGHHVKTAFEMGCHQSKDNLLIRQVAEQFDVFVTIDRGFEHEHNLKNLPVGVVIVHVARNKFEFYAALSDELLKAVTEVRPGTAFHVRAHPGC